VLPRDNSPQPCAESDRDSADRCVVVQDVTNGATSADGADRDAIGRRWPAERTPARLATAATSVAKLATEDGQMGESAGSNAPGRPTGGARQASRRSRSRRVENANRIAATVPMTRRMALSIARYDANVKWFCPDAILARDTHRGNAQHTRRLLRLKQIPVAMGRPLGYSADRKSALGQRKS
jgi:hypothetical protein